MTALRVGVVGGGLIAQAVHLPNLARDHERFIVCAVAEPSPKVGSALGRRYGAQPYTNWRAMVDGEELDALVVCSPHATHAEVVLGALDAGLHVFVEKPLCIAVEDAEAIAARAAAVGRVVQVGYMKRYHPSFDAFVDGVKRVGGELRCVDVLTFDPWMAREPYVPWSDMVQADDVPAAVLTAGRKHERLQVERAVGRGDDESVRAFSYTYLACLVHDVNFVIGALDALGVEGLEPVRSEAWGAGEGASATLRLPSGGLWHCTWLLLRSQPRFRERIAFYFADGVHELEAGVPYDTSTSVEYVVDGLPTPIAGDPYVAELEHFHACAVHGATCLTPPEQAARDIALLRDLFVKSGDS